jgi:hypothetical protein
MEDQEKELAVVVGYIMFYDLLEDLINGSYFSKIDKAIEIAKDYSTAKSGNFINGILDAALVQLSEEGEIQKSGRGLIESSINS